MTTQIPLASILFFTVKNRSMCDPDRCLQRRLYRGLIVESFFLAFGTCLQAQCIQTASQISTAQDAGAPRASGACRRSTQEAVVRSV